MMARREEHQRRMRDVGLLALLGALLVAVLMAAPYVAERRAESICEDEVAAIATERDAALEELESYWWEWQACAWDYDSCLDANASTALALNALANREDGCNRFLCLDPYSGNDVCAGETDWGLRRLLRAELGDQP